MDKYAFSVTGELRNTEKVFLDGQSGDFKLRGEIYGDTKGRFSDGEVVITSTVMREFGGNWFGTRNSAYGVKSWKVANDNTPHNHAAAINLFAADCHAASRRAGWYTDLATGKALDRNVPEMLCLIHSEISEAMEGYRKSKPGKVRMDDKLPHRPMAEVELADAMIRIGDLAAFLGYDLGGAIVEKMAFNANRPDHKIENRLKAGGKAF